MDKNTFSTDSYLLACYLLSESCQLVSIDRTNPRRMVFIFQESKRRKELTDNFLAYQASIEPHRFHSAQRDLKAMIYQRTTG
ncbi:DUF5659 domain-containing protein [Patescibacteria group bacterium]|nr:DUF5659 domain-containing protein [Patescibacteria group bacterium]